MRNRKSLSIVILIFTASPLMAQEAESMQSSLWDGPNMALAIVALVQLIAIIAVAGILKRVTTNSEFFIKITKMRDSQELKNLALFVAFGGWASLANAQSNPDDVPVYPEFFSDPNTLMLLGLNAILLLAFIYMTRTLRKTIALLMPELEKTPEEAKASSESSFMHALTDAIPLDREHEVMTDHEYDGIRELDNNLPPWWVWMFYATIVFAFVYLIYYHVLPYGQTQEEEYIAEVEQAEADRQAYLAQAKNLVDENTVAYLGDVADLNAGKAIYMELCQVCHAGDGGGGVGPNFTDEYWLHGGSIQSIFKTVKYGVPSKGMISWESQLRPVQMAQVASYIQSLGGTTPAAPKEPQGEKYIPEDNSEPVEDTSGEEEGVEEEIEEATAAM